MIRIILSTLLLFLIFLFAAFSFKVIGAFEYHQQLVGKFNVVLQQKDTMTTETLTRDIKNIMELKD